MPHSEVNPWHSPPRCACAMTSKEPTMTTAANLSSTSPIPILDALMQALAWAVRPVSRVVDAGAFWISEGSSVVDCWRESSGWTLRLGRLELVVDLKD